MPGIKTCCFSAVGAALLFCAIALSGCNRSPNVMMGYEKAAGGAGANLSISNRRLQKRITIEEPNARRVNDILQVSVQLVSSAKKTLAFEYQFQWLDADDFVITDPKAHWTPALIYGGDRFRVQQMAPSPRAVTFKLLIRAPESIDR